MGSTGSILYKVSLSVYYASVIKFNIKEKAFRRKVELWCHLIPNAFAISTSVFLQTHHYFNSVGKCDAQMIDLNVEHQRWHVLLLTFLSDNACWISASPISCLTDPDVPCIRGDTMAIEYRKWLALYVALLGFIVITINMVLIIYTVLVQKRRSDRWRFGIFNSTRDNQHRLLLAYLFQKMRTCVCCKCWWAKKREIYLHTTDVKVKSAFPPRESIVSHGSKAHHFTKACLETVEILNVAAFHDQHSTRPKTLPVSRKFADGDNGLSDFSDSKTRANASRSGTKEDHYAFNIGKVRSSIRRESILNSTPKVQGTSTQRAVRAATSRSGTAADPYAFNISNFRSSARRESILNTNPEKQGRTLTSRARSDLLDDTYDAKTQSSHRRASTGTCATCTSISFDVANRTFDRKTSLVRSVSLPEQEAKAPPPNARTEDNKGQKEKAVISQALLYIAAYVITFLFPMISRTMNLNDANQVPFVPLILSGFFMPLQGIFTIYVYTRPHVKSIQKNNPHYSWFKAFQIAFMAGGDNDSVGQTQGSSGVPMTDAEKKKRQDRIKKDFQKRMSAIESRKALSAGHNPTISHIKGDSKLSEPLDDEDGSVKWGQNVDVDINTIFHCNEMNVDAEKKGELEIQNQIPGDEEVGLVESCTYDFNSSGDDIDEDK